jgi:hypothetical protein
MKAEPKASHRLSSAEDAPGDFAQFTDFMNRLAAVQHSVVQVGIR